MSENVYSLYFNNVDTSNTVPILARILHDSHLAREFSGGLTTLQALNDKIHHHFKGVEHLGTLSMAKIANMVYTHAYADKSSTVWFIRAAAEYHAPLTVEEARCLFDVSEAHNPPLGEERTEEVKNATLEKARKVLGTRKVDLEWLALRALITKEIFRKNKYARNAGLEVLEKVFGVSIANGFNHAWWTKVLLMAGKLFKFPYYVRDFTRTLAESDMNMHSVPFSTTEENYRSLLRVYRNKITMVAHKSIDDSVHDRSIGKQVSLGKWFHEAADFGETSTTGNNLDSIRREVFVCACNEFDNKLKSLMVGIQH